MKKLGLLILGGIAAIILLVNLGPIVIFALSIVILYYVFKGFMKADTSLSKVAWGVLGLLMVTAIASNIPALVGFIAAIVLYFIYKKWDGNDGKLLDNSKHESSDPFVNFEKEWAQLKRNY